MEHPLACKASNHIVQEAREPGLGFHQGELGAGSILSLPLPKVVG